MLQQNVHHIVSTLLEGLAKTLSCNQVMVYFVTQTCINLKASLHNLVWLANHIVILQKHLSTVKPASNGNILLHCLYHVKHLTRHSLYLTAVVHAQVML